MYQQCRGIGNDLGDDVLILGGSEGVSGYLKKQTAAHHFQFDTYSKMRKYIDEHFDCARAFVMPKQAAQRGAASTAEVMEVDAFYKNGTKGGNGKQKGNSKGKEKKSDKSQNKEVKSKNF